jgi:hypothetical protein
MMQGDEVNLSQCVCGHVDFVLDVYFIFTFNLTRTYSRIITVSAVGEKWPLESLSETEVRTSAS